MPFPGDITATANATLLFSAVAAISYLLIVTRPPTLARTVVKTGSTALLAVLAAFQDGPALLVAALALCALGDAFLSRDGDGAFIAGLASFLAAHLAYIALFWLEGTGITGLATEPWRWLAVAFLGAFTTTMTWYLLPAVPVPMRVPVAAYIAAIFLMGLTALLTNRVAVIAGAAMFIASDAILATEKFLLRPQSAHRQWMPFAVWILYYTAQLAITLGYLA